MYPRVSLYALMLAAAGIPLYIHLPLFAATQLELSLAIVGIVLVAIRVIDLVQDPALGWMVDHWPKAQPFFALLAALALGAAFPWLFSLQPGPGVAWQMLAVLVVLFSAYSLGMILIYGRSATLAGGEAPSLLLRVAAYREGGMLAGVILAASAPALLAGFGAARDGYPAFGWLLLAVALLSAGVTWPIWQRPAILAERTSIAALLSPDTIRLLIIALVNALPVAITSTLFLFFVEDRLQLTNLAGPLLILFFLCAGVSVPFWTAVAKRIGIRTTLLFSMPLAIAAFVTAGLLPAGATLGFALVCAASGAALGADMVLLPAFFSISLARAKLQASLAFGLWSFAGKLGLALAAFLVLPALGAAGYQPGETNSDTALAALNIAYAVMPCLLKLAAIALVLTLPREESSL